MAHVCPECGSACYCHGDIDDCEIPGEEEHCDHWKQCEVEDEEDSEEYMWDSTLTPSKGTTMKLWRRIVYRLQSVYIAYVVHAPLRTAFWSEHPDDYDNACACDSCRSYMD